LKRVVAYHYNVCERNKTKE